MAEGDRGLRNALAALQYRDYRRFALSLGLTSFSMHLLQTAIFWQVYELTGSALLLGFTGLARAAPHVVLSLVGGVIADRADRARLIQVGQAANGVLILALAAITLIDAAEVWHLYVVTFLNSVFSAISAPARTAIIPSLVPRRGLVNAVALNATINQSSQIVGPAVAGIAIATLGLGASYLTNGLAYLLAMVVIMGIHPPAVRKTTDSPWRSFVEGMQFVRRRRVIVSLLMLDLGAMVLGSYRALLPIFSDALGAGEAGYGLLSSSPGIGAVIGASWTLSLGDMRYKGLYAAGGVLAYCASLALLALAPWFWLAVLAGVLLGVTNALQTIPRNSAILAIPPDALRGRVEAFRGMLAGGGPPVGFALSGALAAAFGAPFALVIGAIACTVFVGGILASDPELRDPMLGTTADEDDASEAAPPVDGGRKASA